MLPTIAKPVPAMQERMLAPPGRPRVSASIAGVAGQFARVAAALDGNPRPPEWTESYRYLGPEILGACTKPPGNRA
jgi:hypothetical protein